MVLCIVHFSENNLCNVLLLVWCAKFSRKLFWITEMLCRSLGWVRAGKGESGRDGWVQVKLQAMWTTHFSFIFKNLSLGISWTNKSSFLPSPGQSRTTFITYVWTSEICMGNCRALFPQGQLTCSTGREALGGICYPACLIGLRHILCTCYCIMHSYKTVIFLRG